MYVYKALSKHKKRDPCLTHEKLELVQNISQKKIVRIMFKQCLQQCLYGLPNFTKNYIAPKIYRNSYAEALVESCRLHFLFRGIFFFFSKFLLSFRNFIQQKLFPKTTKKLKLCTFSDTQTGPPLIVFQIDCKFRFAIDILS